MEEKIQIDVYDGIPMVLEKVKGVALGAVIGKSSSWIDDKLKRRVKRGNELCFTEKDVEILNGGLCMLGNEIAASMITYNSDREDVICQIKELAKLIVMSYIYTNALKQKTHWYRCRMLPRKPGGKATSFKEEHILQINMAAMQIANELRSIEFVLK